MKVKVDWLSWTILILSQTITCPRTPYNNASLSYYIGQVELMNATAISSEFASISAIQLIQILLLLITIVLSGASLRSQIRAGIRESVEQLAPVASPGSSFRIHPLLHKVTFWKFESTVSLKFYRTLDQTVASRQTTVEHELHHDDKGYIADAIQSVQESPGVYKVEIVEDEILVSIRSLNAVKVRRITDDLQRHFELDEHLDTFDYEGKLDIQDGA